MGALLLKIINSSYLFILLYAGYNLYLTYEVHTTEMAAQVADGQTLDLKIKGLNKKVKELDSYYADVEEMKRRIELVAQQVEKVQQQLPQKISDIEDLDQITGFAKELNLRNIYLAPQIEENKGFYFLKNYEFKAEGTFLQFLIFLEKLGQSKRILNIGKIELTKTNAKQKGRYQLLSAQIIIQSFRYNPMHRESRELEKSETTRPAANNKGEE